MLDWESVGVGCTVGGLLMMNVTYGRSFFAPDTEFLLVWKVPP
jgi:hypothetical protein